MARSEANRKAFEAAGMSFVDGSLDDLPLLSQLVRDFDTIVFAPMIPFEAEAPVLAALIDSCRGSSRHLMYISGTGVIAMASPEGTWDENTFAEDDPFPFPEAGSRAVRLKTEQLVRAAGRDNVRTTVIRPPWIWGNAGGILIWQLAESARRTGTVCYVGHGLNLYSNVHVDDVASAFALACDHGTSGALYHTVAGEVNVRAVAEAVAQMMGCQTRSVDYATACEIWSPDFVDLGVAVNSRSRAVRARKELGWTPRHLDVIEDIRSGSYRDAYAAAGSGFSYDWQSHG
jgi:nucleoside-diphosphate-sugar epimerase